MNALSPFLDDSFIETIPIHFDMDQHKLPMEDFFQAARCAAATIECLNHKYFEGKLKYKLYVIPPKEGGFLAYFGVSVIIAAWQFLESDMGKAYVDELTGHPPDHWARIAARKTKEYFKEETNVMPAEIERAIEKKSVAIILKEGTISFFQKQEAELKKAGLTPKTCRKAFIARNKFYEDSSKNKEIKSIGFTEEYIFPVQKKDFAKYIVLVPEEDKTPDEIENWEVETIDIIANSPNWKRDGRSWQAQTTNGETTFVVEDGAFWKHISMKNIPTRVNDHMKVQWAYPKGRRSAQKKVLRVLSFNGKPLSPPLTDTELKLILNNFGHKWQDDPELF